VTPRSSRRSYEGVAVAVPVTVPYARYSTHGAHWFIGQAVEALVERSGIAKDAVQSTAVTRCIAVKSAKGREYPLFIQDALAGSLAKDVKVGGKLTLYGSLVYFAARGPGIVVNEYATEQTTPPQSHSGVDLSAVSKKKK